MNEIEKSKYVKLSLVRLLRTIFISFHLGTYDSKKQFCAH